MFNDKSEKGDHELIVNDEKIKEMDFVDIEDYFQIEVIEGETVFVCNIWNKGLANEMEITKHIIKTSWVINRPGVAGAVL